MSSIQPPPPPPPPPQQAPPAVEIMDLTADSILEKQKHDMLMIELEAKKRESIIDVPTLPNEVKNSLRKLNHPVRYFGENLADVRNRLRRELAKIEVMKEQGIAIMAQTSSSIQLQQQQVAQKEEAREEEQVTKYTHASKELIVAREYITTYSLEKSKERLNKEYKYRIGSKKRVRLMKLAVADRTEKENNDPDIKQVVKIDDDCTKLYKSLRNVTLEGTQFADERAVSSICTAVMEGDNNNRPVIATGSWSGSIKLWDGSTTDLVNIGTKNMAHEDRITGISATSSNNKNNNDNNNIDSNKILLATASIDLNGKIWEVTKNSNENSNENGNGNGNNSSNSYNIKEICYLKGHKSRLCKIKFHPTNKYVGTTSYDHTWRLWDIETSKQLLLQDGHYRETYGISFHNDGSLVSTSDFSSIIHLWDIRTSKSILHFGGGETNKKQKQHKVQLSYGHTKRVLCTEFCSSNNNGFQLASAGDDGTIKIWDIRTKNLLRTIPAHTNLISQLVFNDEYIVSSSFDGTSKIWSSRNGKLLSTLYGHQGKVMGIDILPTSARPNISGNKNLLFNGIVTSGYDKTIKLWK